MSSLSSSLGLYQDRGVDFFAFFDSHLPSDVVQIKAFREESPSLTAKQVSLTLKILINHKQKAPFLSVR
jgi:hypothetical protein